MAGEFISISTDQWTRSIALYTVGLKKALQEVLTEEWPFLIRQVMNFTPPFRTGDTTSGKRSGAGSFSASDQSVGRAAVARDIHKTMRPFDPANVRTRGLKKILDARDIAAFNALAARRKTGPMVGKRAVHFNKSEHTSQRNARGRIGRDLKQVVLGAESAHLAQYIILTQAKVGIAKSGWWPALALVGGNAPGYVTKHGFGQGAYIDDRANELDPSITAINRTPWAVRKDEAQRIISYALASRARAIESKVRTKLRLEAREARLAV